MNSKAGFLLSAYLVYITLVVLITATAIRLSVLIIPQAYCLMEWCAHTDFYGACDLLYKDLCCAPVFVDKWYKADKEGFIWHTGDTDHGWLIVENRLMYKEGAYDQTSKKWSSVTTSLIARDVHIESIDFLTQSGKVQEVSCSAYIQSKPVHFWHCRRIF